MSERFGDWIHEFYIVYDPDDAFEGLPIFYYTPRVIYSTLDLLNIIGLLRTF